MTIETKEIVIGEELKKVDMICRVAYTKQHILKVNDNEYLLFD